MVAGRKRDGHATQDHGDAKYLRDVELGAKPEPFNHDGNGRGEALREQNGAAAAKSRQSLEIRRVTQANAGQPAQNENGKCRATCAGAQGVRPDRQKKKRAANTPEIGLDTTEPRRGAMTADCGQGEQQRGEQRGEHQESVRTVSTRVMSQSPPIFWKVNFISCTLKSFWPAACTFMVTSATAD